MAIGRIDGDLLQTEEDIKIKFVVPYLKSLGFQDNEFSFEKNFSIRLGRHQETVDTENQIRVARPRLDILVKRNGTNLFVVEVKTDSSDLTEDDKDQAISYARLVHPMAPFAIVTNGKTTKMYLTVDKTEAEETQWDKAKILDYRIEKDLASIYEDALEHFIGYSKDNVRVFCNAQINEGMSALLGSREAPHKKFIPELYVRSNSLAKKFESFLSSDKSIFALVGESGAGKTCSMCGLARDLVKDHPVFFYRGQDLMTGPMKCIADDFNWTFSPQYDEIPLFKRLGKLFRDGQIIVFADGVDEWSNPDKVEILGSLAKQIRSRNFKLVISCKSGQWETFLKKRGTPTSLSEEVFSPDTTCSGYFVEAFDEQEFFKLVDNYRRFYQFRGLFEADVLEECRPSLFLLRLFFEVAKKTQCTHLTFSLKEFYDEYYESVLQRMDNRDREIAERTLRVTAKLQFESNGDSIDEEALRRELGLHVNDSILPALFECNILERSRIGGDTQVSFYFKKLRDYVIAFRAEKWDRKSRDEFQRTWEGINRRGAGLDAAMLFYQLADNDKKRLMDEPFRSKAEAYVQSYTELLDRHFLNFKERFSPQTTGTVGFFGILDFLNQRVVAYGFRRINEGDERIKFIPTQGGFWGGKSTNLPYLLGADKLHYYGSSDGFNDIDIKTEVLDNEVITQLKAIVEKGLLNESDCFYLSLEKALGLIVAMQKELHGIVHLGALSKYLPIDINRVEYGIRYERAKRYYEHKRFKEKAEQGLISPVMSHVLSREDREYIHHQADDAASNHRQLDSEVSYPSLEREENALLEAVAIIKRRTGVINEAILPDRDTVTGAGAPHSWAFFKRETLAAYIHRIYSLFLEEYKILVETNFPTLKRYFRLYSEMPVHYVLCIPLSKENQRIDLFDCLTEDVSQNTVTLCTPEEIKFDSDAFFLTLNGHRCKVRYARMTWIDSFLSPPERHSFAPLSTEFTILRSMIYKQVREELETVLQQLRATV